MDKIMQIAEKHHLWVVEDAAQASDSYYNGKPLGGIGHLGCFSFHETKNIQCGEGGMLMVNHQPFEKRAEIIWEKGTNRAEFFRGEVNKYDWVDIGSSFLPSEISAAFLWAQLEKLEDIQIKRKQIWDIYHEGLREVKHIRLPEIPGYATNNVHMFYVVCKSLQERTKLISKLKDEGISAVFHYQSLHASYFYKNKHDGRQLPYAEMYSDCLVRLPLFYELKTKEVKKIIAAISNNQ
jgi:dTDP-4-amino-4,6-dideoxygalactose transaminase